MKQMWVNPTSLNYSKGQAVQFNNLTPGQLIFGVYLAIRTNVSGETYHRWMKLPVVVDDGYGALFFSGSVLFDFDPTVNGNYLVGYGFASFRDFVLSDTSTVNVNGYYSGLFDSSNMFVQSGEIVDGSFFNLGTALRVGSLGT